MPRLVGRKSLILRTAATLFARNGYEATSLAEIAKAAGSNTGSLMYFFRSKAHLVLAVRDSVVTDLAATVGAALDRHPRDVAKAVERAIAAYLAWAAGSPEQVALLRELANVRLAGERTDRDLLGEASGVLQRWAAPLVKAGIIPTLEPGHLFAVMLGPVVTFCSTSSPERLSDPATPALASVLHLGWSEGCPHRRIANDRNSRRARARRRRKAGRHKGGWNSGSRHPWAVCKGRRSPSASLDGRASS